MAWPWHCSKDTTIIMATISPYIKTETSKVSKETHLLDLFLSYWILLHYISVHHSQSKRKKRVRNHVHQKCSTWTTFLEGVNTLEYINVYEQIRVEGCVSGAFQCVHTIKICLRSVWRKQQLYFLLKNMQLQPSLHFLLPSTMKTCLHWRL